MPENLHQRLEQILDHYDLSKNAFDNSIGKGNGYIGKQIKNHASIGSETLQKILSVYQDINPSWLICGEGPMLRSQEDKGSQDGDLFEQALLICLTRQSIQNKIIEITSHDFQNDGKKAG